MKIIVGLIISVLLHIGFLFLFPAELSGDATVYDYSAKTFAQSGELRSLTVVSSYNIPELKDRFSYDEPLSHFAFGFPLFLGVIYKIVGANHTGTIVSKIILALLVAIIIPLFMLYLAQALKLSNSLQNLAFYLGVIWPSGFFLTNFLLSESLSAVLLIIFIFLAYEVYKGKERFLLLGITASLLFFVRHEFVFWIFFAYAFLYPWKKRKTASATVGLVILLLSFLIPTVRNYISYREFIPLTSAGGETFWAGSICSDTFFFSTTNRDVAIRVYSPNPKETEKRFLEEAKNNIRKDPITYLKCFPKRATALFLGAYNEPAWGESNLKQKMEKIFLRLFKLALLLGFLFSLPILWKSHRFLFFLTFGFFAYKYLGIHLLIHGNSRFFTPFEPIAIVLSCLSLPRLFQKT